MNNSKREKASINYNMIKYMSKQKKIASNAAAKGIDTSSLKEKQKLLLKIYSLSQNENSLEYKNIHEENEEFHKSYTFYKELTKNKYNLLLTFEDLILEYKQRGFKIPDFSTKHNLFSQSPLLLSSFNKIKMYYKYNKFNEEKLENYNALEKLKEIENSNKKNKNKNKNNNNNENDIKIKLNEGEKTFKYLEKLDDYLIEQNFSQMMKNKNKKKNDNNDNNYNINNSNKNLNKRRSSIDKNMILLRMEDIQREKRNSLSLNNIKLLKARRNSIQSLMSDNLNTDTEIDKLKKEIKQLKKSLKEYEEEEDRYKKTLSVKNKTRINFLKHFKFAYNFKKKGITPKFLNLSIINNDNQNKENSKELSDSKNSNTLTNDRLNNISKNEINNNKNNTIEASSNRSLKNNNQSNFFSIKFKKKLSRNIKNNFNNSNNFFKTQSTNYNNNISSYRSNISDYSHKSMNKSDYLNTFYELTKKQILKENDLKTYLIKYDKDFNNNNLNVDEFIKQEINTRNIYNNVGKLQKKINDKEEFFLSFPILTANNAKNIKIIKNLDKKILKIDRDLVKGAIKVKFNS